MVLEGKFELDKVDVDDPTFNISSNIGLFGTAL